MGLFTNVPLKEVIDICARTLYHEDVLEVPPPTLTEASFRELLQKVTSGVEFSFEGVMYKQIDGVAMGSPLGPILANIFDGYHEKRIQSHPWPQVYDRYVDDIFSHFLSKEACNEFFVTLNNLHPALKFTREDEQDDSLPFLDVLVNRMAQEFSTSIYRKPTFTGLYTPWDSFSATRYKTNTVRALVNRAVRICSPSLLDDELGNIRRIFLRNGYPGSVLEKMVSNKQHERLIGPRKCPIVIHLPWLGHNTATRFEKKIVAAVRCAYYAAKVQFAYSTRRAFTLPKDRLPTPLASNVVYSFEC